MNLDVVDLITADHREVERLFEELKTKPDQRPLLVPVLAALLTAHSRAEEAEVYPAARDEADETEEVAHSQEEHLEAERILQRLAETDPDASQFEEILQELVDAVQHHVEEEESTVLPGLREHLDDRRRRQLGEAFAAYRSECLTKKVGDPSRDELKQQAENLDLPGRSSLTKQELKQQLTER